MKHMLTDPKDPRIAAYQMIRERDLVGREGLFVAEGEVVLSHLVSSPLVDVLSVLIVDKRADGLTDVLCHLGDEVPIYVAPQAVMDTIVGFPIHRGILALGRRREIPTASQMLDRLPPRCLVLGLVGVCNHDNMGGIFRNAAAFGVDGVLLDQECCDPLYRKSIRVSVGGILKMPYARLNIDENMVALLEQRQIAPFALSPSGSLNLTDLCRPTRAAVILGAEGPGLPNAVLKACQTVSIRMANGFDSLNVATTSGIVLHQFSTNIVI